MPAAVPDQTKSPPDARSIEPMSPPWFQDVTEQVGLDFVDEAGPTGKYFMPQLVGSGAALRPRRRRTPQILPASEWRTGLKCPQPLVPTGRRWPIHRRQPRLGAGHCGAQHGRGHRRRQQRGRPDVVGHAVWRHQALSEQWQRHVHRRHRGRGARKLCLGHVGLRFRLRPRRLARPRCRQLCSTTTRPRNAAAPRRSDVFCGPRSFEGTAAQLFHNRGRSADGKGVRFEDVTEKSGLGPPAGPRSWRHGGRLQRRRLARHLRGQRRGSQSPVDQPARRHVRRRSPGRAASPSMASARSRGTWGLRWATCTATACSTCSSPT